MALVSYVLLSTLLAGLRGSFDPALLSSVLSWAVFVVFLEIAILNLFKVCLKHVHFSSIVRLMKTQYFLSINSVSSLLDLLCYAGYKFVHINVTILLSEIWYVSLPPPPAPFTTTNPNNAGTAVAAQAAGSAGPASSTSTTQTRTSCSARCATSCCPRSTMPALRRWAVVRSPDAARGR